VTRDLDRLSVLSDPVRGRLFEHVRHSAAPVGREDAAAAAGISRSLAAYHLDKLVEHGLLAATYSRPEGRGGPGAGRPAKVYSPADDEVSVSVPARDYELVARLLAAAAESDAGGGARAALRDVAGRAGAALAEHAADDSLLELLARGGYEPYEDGEGVIRLRNCPFHRLAAEHRELVCGMNEAYLAGVVAGAGRDDLSAALEPEPGRCCVAIRRS
jgi:predicted ArsR family transcriptional regulator